MLSYNHRFKDRPAAFLDRWSKSNVIVESIQRRPVSPKVERAFCCGFILPNRGKSVCGNGSLKSRKSRQDRDNGLGDSKDMPAQGYSVATG